jgi:putative transcriptional regulator
MTKTGTKNMTKAGMKIMQAMQQALDGDVTTYPAEEDSIDVKRIRDTLGMNRDQFALAFHFSKYSVRNWELGKRNPSGATHTLLQLIAADPLDAYHKLHA